MCGPSSRYNPRVPRPSLSPYSVPPAGDDVIISRTPFRVSFFGGGTDYPAWFRLEGGAVLSTTIDKYCYVTCRYAARKHRSVSSHVETGAAILDTFYPAIREGLRALNVDDSIELEIQHQGDLPARAGMGSSSSFTVGLVKALVELRGQTIGKHELALKAIDLEQNVLRERVGCQDQVAAAYGGLNVIEFATNGDIRVEPVTIAPDRRRALEERLILVHSGTSRLAPSIAADIIARMSEKGQELRAMRRLVDRAYTVLTSSGDLDRFGDLLHQGWMIKRGLSAAVSNATIDRIYSLARANGALGGKLLGAGAAGFMVFYVPPARRHAVLTALGDYPHVRFSFDTEASTIIYNSYNEVSPMVVAQQRYST